MNKKPIQRALIVGATSGIGKETALQLLQKGWILGLAGRREENLKELQQLAPDRIHIRAIDICQEDATDRLLELIEEMGGMDLYLHCSGIGHQNYQLAPEIELRTLETNGTGFVRMVTAAALEQLARIQKLLIRFTDIRPGFVATGLLNDGKHYPMLMHTEKVARHIVCALEKKKRIVVIDWRYRILVALWRLIPPFLWKRMTVRN